MNETIKLLKSHRTYRDFDPDFIIPEEQFQQIITAAKQAASWMNGQHYTIIEISDAELRQKIFDILPQKQILESSRFLIFVADLFRMSQTAKLNQTEFSNENDVESLIIAVTDLALSAQNAVIAAESFGYGTNYIGSVRGIAAKLIEWLELPQYTFPIVGLCIGKPTVEMRVKPRLPNSITFFKNKYDTVNSKQAILNYDKTMLEFAEARETLPWSVKFANFYARPWQSGLIKLLQQQDLYK